MDTPEVKVWRNAYGIHGNLAWAVDCMFQIRTWNTPCTLHLSLCFFWERHHVLHCRFRLIQSFLSFACIYQSSTPTCKKFRLIGGQSKSCRAYESLAELTPTCVPKIKPSPIYRQVSETWFSVSARWSHFVSCVPAVVSIFLVFPRLVVFAKAFSETVTRRHCCEFIIGCSLNCGAPRVL